MAHRPSLLGAAGATVRTRDLLRAGDELSAFVQSRYVHAFFRGWESLGLHDTKQTIPTQLVHSVGASYALRGATPLVLTVEAQNVTNAATYDSYGVQRPGRGLFAKLSAEL